MDWPEKSGPKNWELLGQYLEIGHGSPEGVVKKRGPCLYLDLEGGTMWIKENTDFSAEGWVEK